MKIYMVGIDSHRIAYGATKEIAKPSRFGLFLSISDAKSAIAEYLGLEKKDIKWKKGGGSFRAYPESSDRCFRYDIVITNYENGKLIPAY